MLYRHPSLHSRFHARASINSLPQELTLREFSLSAMRDECASLMPAYSTWQTSLMLRKIRALVSGAATESVAFFSVCSKKATQNSWRTTLTFVSGLFACHDTACNRMLLRGRAVNFDGSGSGVLRTPDLRSIQRLIAIFTAG